VNVASRIEGLTKSLGHDVLVSETTWSAIDTKRLRGARVTETAVKGRKDPVVVYSLDAQEPGA
jgi:adenylate cyclase